MFRTFPIRVAGEQAGHLKDEITWEVLQRESGYPCQIQEMTTVSKKLRRIGRFDWVLAEQAIRTNRPSRVAINGLDYLDYQDSTAANESQLSSRSVQFLRRLQICCGLRARYLGVGSTLDRIVETNRVAEERIGAIA